VTPLTGRRIVVTRPAHSADALCQRLEALGASVIRRPAIEVTGVPGDVASDALLRKLASCDWAVFTSASGVTHGLARLESLDMGPHDFVDVRVAAVGPATTCALRDAGIDVAAMPATHIGARIADVVGPIDGRRFLLFRGDIASPDLPERLRAAGGHVDEVIVYATTPLGQAAGATPPLHGIDAVTFTSPSTVRGFLDAIGDEAADLFPAAAIVTIGPVTSAEVRKSGLDVAAEATTHTIDGLVTAIVDFFSKPSIHSQNGGQR
jgi:uroporphyrinogen III methyltransferase / synthase